MLGNFKMKAEDTDSSRYVPCLSRDLHFCHHVRTILVSTKPPVQWVQGVQVPEMTL
jgi:hypothetical protein